MTFRPFDFLTLGSVDPLMNYEQSLEYLNGLLKFGIKPGLERITALCEAFGNPQRQLRAIHITGTNGKGSTAAFVDSILREAGYIVGLYLSPYVHDVRERVQIDGQMISEERFAALATEIKPVADRIGRTDLGQVTEFEVKTMMAYLWLARSKVDFAVLEVGMGGRLDTTNLVQPLVAVITNVSLDHTERLGDTVPQIAQDKSGIIKTGTVLVTAAADESAWRVILDACREQGVESWRVMSSRARKFDSPSADVQLRYTSKGDHFSLHGGEIHMTGLSPGLKGSFQHVNAATAIAAILAMERYEVRISPQAIFKGISSAYVPGRLEVIRENPTLLLDGAHNPEAARTLAKEIRESFRYERLILVIGMLGTHSADGVLEALAPIASHIVVTQSKWHLARPASELAETARRFSKSVEVIDDIPTAVRTALDQANDKDLILVTGSFYTLGETPNRDEL